MVERVKSGTMITRLLELALSDPKYQEELERLRKPIVVMFTDIQGSTAYFEKHGDVAGLMMVHQCGEALRGIIERYGGRVIKTIGDGMMMTFSEQSRSVEAAIEIQKALVAINSSRPESDRVAIRIGIHYGEGIVKTNDVFGDVVNVASRVESVAAPGQIVISDSLYEQLHQHKFSIEELGRFALKGKSNERTLFHVIWKSTVNPAIAPPRDDGTGQVKAPGGFKLQLVNKDGSAGPEYPVGSSVTIGRSEGDVRFTSDPNMAPLNARVFVEDGQLFVRDISNGAESVFVRLEGGYTLQDHDIVIMGQQVFRFREMPGAMSAVTELGASLGEITNALERPVARFVRLDASGNRSGDYPLRTSEVQFGRTRGTYSFPEDKLMSRAHARVLQRGEDFLLEDVGSRNGTFVKVRGKVLLPVGSAVLVGSQLLRVTG